VQEEGTSRVDPDRRADEEIESPGLGTALLVLLGGLGGALVGVLVLPVWLPDLAGSLDGQSPKAFWYLSRASGLVAYVLLWLSVACGLLISGRLARLWPGGPTAVDLHQYSGLLGLGFALFHGLILLGDRYVGYAPVQVLVPFAGRDYRPLEVGLGQVGFYLGLLVAFSSYARRRIGYRAWRLLHYGGFAVYALATLHGLTAGTDARQPAVFALYGLTALATFFLLVFRVLVSTRATRAALT
jgi:predicted ferric reductase